MQVGTVIRVKLNGRATTVRRWLSEVLSLAVRFDRKVRTTRREDKREVLGVVTELRGRTFKVQLPDGSKIQLRRHAFGRERGCPAKWDYA